ncbi:AAA family ATPase [Paenarthrobacter sp. NPDC089675]|uniref:AAA family ATPase n=1 Tax=Paenarthrobacter sp. NPDC089675 TaxID=3364376 RepID=UPI00380A3A41
MKLSISGTYSAGKTSTVIALAHYTGMPRTLAKTIREIMPHALPGKKLAEVTPAEYLQIAMRRHTGRAVAEAVLGDQFISDGSSLQEWIYGAARVRFGMNPSSTADIEEISREDLTQEMLFFEAVIDQFGHAFRQHVKDTYTAFVHLENERPLTNDGHRPMNERFRTFCDEMLMQTVERLDIPCWHIKGTMEERLETITSRFNLPTVMPLAEAVALMEADYAAIDQRLENERQKARA